MNLLIKILLTFYEVLIVQCRKLLQDTHTPVASQANLAPMGWRVDHDHSHSATYPSVRHLPARSCLQLHILAGQLWASAAANACRMHVLAGYVSEVDKVRMVKGGVDR